MKIQYLIYAALFSTSLALATPGGEGDNTNCNGQGNPNSPCVPGGNGGGNGGTGGQGGAGGSGGQGGAGGTSVATQGQAQGQLQGQAQGQAQGQNQVASGGSSDVAVSISGDDYGVSTAATIFAQTCQQGASGQGDDFGASAVFSDPLCDSLKVASVYWDYSQLLLKTGDIAGSVHYRQLFDDEMAQVETLMESTEELAVADRAAGFMIKPMGVVTLLLMLL